jgi:hypothetical protein
MQEETPPNVEKVDLPPAAAPLIHVSERELAAAFTEWDRRYREEPERFMSEAQHLLKETPQTYGDACAPYLIKILGELGR